MSGRFINLAIIEWDCGLCGGVYRVHREHRNVCPHCKGDFGYMISVQEFNERMREAYPLDESDECGTIYG